MRIKRALQLEPFLKRKSCFLFGARGVGKTHLVRDQLGSGQALYIDLLRGRVLTTLSADPGELENLVGKAKRVVIDEIQKVPALLDEVHRLIEDKGIRFLLTGSSARKLKRGQANLLGGRAWRLELFPLTSREIPDFDLARALRFGLLPAVWTSGDPDEELDAYVSTYLKEEILAEGLSRNLPAFSRFLKVAALSSGQMLNYAQIASDAQVPESTVRGHFEVLSDTLVGFLLEPFLESKKRKAIRTPKFYLMDAGVRNALAGIVALDRHSDLYGSAFEAWLGHELRSYLSYTRNKLPLTYWRSTSQFEVDYLLGDVAAVEVKATGRVTDKHLKGLYALSEEGIFERYYLVTQDELERTQPLSGGAYALLLPWRSFLEKLWAGEITAR